MNLTKHEQGLLQRIGSKAEQYRTEALAARFAIREQREKEREAVMSRNACIRQSENNLRLATR